MKKLFKVILYIMVFILCFGIGYLFSYAADKSIDGIDKVTNTNLIRI